MFLQICFPGARFVNKSVESVERTRAGSLAGARWGERDILCFREGETSTISRGIFHARDDQKEINDGTGLGANYAACAAQRRDPRWAGCMGHANVVAGDSCKSLKPSTRTNTPVPDGSQVVPDPLFFPSQVVVGGCSPHDLIEAMSRN